MSEIIYKTFNLEDIIDFDKCKTNSSSFTKTFINANKGDIPVYGASKDINEVGYGYVKDNLEGIKYFENCLTWNIDGSIAIFYRKNRFSLSEKVIPLILKDELNEKIDLDYLRIMIQQSAEIKNFHFSNKAGKTKLKNIKIQIPVNQNEEIKIEAQKIFVEKYTKLEESANLLTQRKMLLKDVIINDNLLKDFNTTEVNLTEVFIPQRGNSKYTKTFCKDNIGEYPVFSANNSEPLGYRNLYDYDGTYLTVSVNGIAGKITKKEGKFSINADRILLMPQNHFLDLDFIKYSIEPILRKSAKGRMGHDGQNEFTKLPSGIIDNIKIRIPILPDGNYDLNKQKEIANKYRKIEEIKKNISNQIDVLCSTEIQLQ